MCNVLSNKLPTYINFVKIDWYGNSIFTRNQKSKLNLQKTIQLAATENFIAHKICKITTIHFYTILHTYNIKLKEILENDWKAIFWKIYSKYKLIINIKLVNTSW